MRAKHIVATQTDFFFQAIHSTATETLRRIRADHARCILMEKGASVAAQQAVFTQRRDEILESCFAAAQRCSVAIALLLGR